MYETKWFRDPVEVDKWLNSIKDSIEVVGYTAEAGTDDSYGGLWITIKKFSIKS